MRKGRIGDAGAYPLRDTGSAFPKMKIENVSSIRSDAMDENIIKLPNAIYIKQEYMVDSTSHQPDEIV